MMQRFRPNGCESFMLAATVLPAVQSAQGIGRARPNWRGLDFALAAKMPRDEP